jgi:hypothetical protein
VISVGRQHAMREAGVRLKRSVLQQLGRQNCRIAKRHYLVIFTVHDQRRQLNRLQILNEVGFRKALMQS